MSNYIGKETEPNALTITVSYLEGPAHEWWINFKKTEKGSDVNTWPKLQDALLERFETLNKVKITRDKLARWKQLKDVNSYNEDFQNILMDIPNINEEEQIDRYTRELKPFFWKELCTREYVSLSEAMKDAERVESAHRRSGKPQSFDFRGNRTVATNNSEPVPMDIGNLETKKLTQTEREICVKEGKCYRCREKSHIAKNCPKEEGN